MYTTSSHSRNISFSLCWSTSAQLESSWSYTWHTSPYSTHSSPGTVNALESRNISIFFSALVSSYINNLEFLYNFEKCKNHTFMVLLTSNSIINLEPRVFQYVLFLWRIKSSVKDIFSNTIKNLGGTLLEWS